MESAPGDESTSPDRAPSPEHGEEPGRTPTFGRGTLTLRALRRGALLAVVVMTIMAVLLRTPLFSPANQDWSRAGISRNIGFWFLAWFLAWRMAFYRRVITNRTATVVLMVVLAACGIGLAYPSFALWWEIRTRSSISLPILLCHSATYLALALMTVTGVPLRALRTVARTKAGAPDDPLRWRRLHRRVEPDPEDPAPKAPADSQAPEAQTSSAEATTPRRRLSFRRLAVPRRERIHLITVALAPTLVLGELVAVVHLLADPVTQVIAAAPDDASLPARPTTVEGGAAWSTEIPGVLNIGAGAAGLIVLTEQGVMGLDPSDGSTRWNYRRDVPYTQLVIGPDGRHAVVRFAPDLLASDDLYYVTVVLVEMRPNHSGLFERTPDPTLLSLYRVTGGRS